MIFVTTLPHPRSPQMQKTTFVCYGCNQTRSYSLSLTMAQAYERIVKKSKQNDIALLIDTALHTIEKNNKALKGALPDNYFSRLGLMFQTGIVARHH